MPHFPFAYPTKKAYNTNVLVGNWFEERCGRLVDKRAIVPGVFGHSSCSSMVKSIYKDSYERPAVEVQEYHEFPRQRFINKLNDRETHFRTIDSDDFVNNMITTMDIAYNIRPKKARLAAETGQKLVDGKYDDMMANYNHTTETGLLRAKRCNRWLEESDCTETTYKNAFKAKHLNGSSPRRAMRERCRAHKQVPPFYTDY